ncbi:hypothetical protein JMJ55_10815 [Belnapia sp. T6]|uniref:General stress protein 17M-like domain-containing protein n=1 Tax=Belnapia mucosa TaxID=2804532 RepID=A0ABS1V290_9PROT|nr:hypothetical protein [Belnapia mucosa]MBL6455815.1 hypothetical protein [Belnapia mucosa]
MTRIVAGLFDNRGEVERVVEHLTQQLGVDPAAVEIHGAGEDQGTPEHPGDRPRGILRSQIDRFLPKADRAVFVEGIRRNGIVLVAQVEERVVDRVMDVFETHGAADLDARQADWRGAGWAPGESGGTGHDEDIGFATYGGDAVFRHIPKHHHDNTPAGLLGRLAMAAMRPEPGRRRAKVRSYVVDPEKQ